MWHIVHNKQEKIKSIQKKKEKINRNKNKTRKEKLGKKEEKGEKEKGAKRGKDKTEKGKEPGQYERIHKAVLKCKSASGYTALHLGGSDPQYAKN